MGSVNKVILVGRLGADPEVKHLQNDRAVCNLSVATSEQWKDKQTGQKQEKTEWHRVTVWGEQAENCGKYLAKGRMVYVEGKLQTRSYEKDGVKQVLTPSPEPGGKDVWKEVKTGIENDTSVEIVSGLAEGQTVVVQKSGSQSRWNARQQPGGAMGQQRMMMGQGGPPRGGR